MGCGASATSAPATAAKPAAAPAQKSLNKEATRVRIRILKQ